MTAIILALAGLIFISGINEPFLSPFTAEVNYDRAISVGYSDKKSAVIDKQGQRVLILNGEGELTSLVDTNKSGSPVDVMTGSFIDGDTIYVVGYTRVDNGIVIDSEKLLSFDLDGNFEEVIYAHEYKGKSKVTAPMFSTLTVSNHKAYIPYVNDKEVSLLKIDPETKKVERLCESESTETVYSGIYVRELDELLIMCRSMNCYCKRPDEERFHKTTYSKALDKVASLTDNQNVSEQIKNMRKTHCFPVISSDNECKQLYYIFVNHMQGDFRILSENGEVYDNPNHADYSIGFFLKNLLHWLSVVVMLISAILFIAWILLKKATKQTITMLITIFVTLFVAGFYSYNSYEETKSHLENTLIGECNQMSQLISSSLGDSCRGIKEYGIKKFCSDPDNADNMDYHQQLIKNLAEVSGAENGLMIEVYLIGEDGTLYTFLDSRNHLPSGLPMHLEKKLLKEMKATGEHHSITYYGTADTLLGNYSYIHDSDGEAVAVLSVSCLMEEVRHTLWQSTLDNFLTLSCILIAAYVFIKVMGIFIADFKRMRSRKPEEKEKKCADMSGLYVFLQSTIYSADSVILVYVAKSLCADIPAETQALMVAMPLTVFAAGALIGKFIFVFISKHVGNRIMAVFSALGLVGFSAVLILSIQLNSIWIFTAGKFFMGILLGGFLYNLSARIPFASGDKKVQLKALSSSAQSVTAASVLSILISGYLSTVLAYQAMYVMAGIMAVFMLMLSLMAIKENEKKKDDETADTNWVELKKEWSVYMKKPMVMYVMFFIVPTVMVSGYTSYLYPMYTAGAGISAMLLSKIAVFSNTLKFVLNDIIAKATRRFDEKQLMVIPTLVICGCLVCFFLSPNIYWAIIVFFMMGIAHKMVKAGEKKYLLKIGDEYGVDRRNTQSNNLLVTSVFNVFRSPVASGFVTLGLNMACTVVGLISGILYGMFGIFLRKGKK